MGREKELGTTAGGKKSICRMIKLNFAATNLRAGSQGRVGGQPRTVTWAFIYASGSPPRDSFSSAKTKLS